MRDKPPTSVMSAVTLITETSWSSNASAKPAALRTFVCAPAVMAVSRMIARAAVALRAAWASVMAARAVLDNLYCFIIGVDLIVNIRFVPENYLPRRACTKSTRHHIDIAAKTAKKGMVSHRGGAR